MTSRGKRTSAQDARNSASSLTRPSRRETQPVATGLSTATRLPRRKKWLAISPATTVLPTSVSVAVTNRPGIEGGWIMFACGFYTCRADGFLFTAKPNLRTLYASRTPLERAHGQSHPPVSPPVSQVHRRCRRRGADDRQVLGGRRRRRFQRDAAQRADHAGADRAGEARDGSPGRVGPAK